MFQWPSRYDLVASSDAVRLLSRMRLAAMHVQRAAIADQIEQSRDTIIRSRALLHAMDAEVERVWEGGGE